MTGTVQLAYYGRAEDLFRALADPARSAILDQLPERNGRTLYELCARLSAEHGIGSTRRAISPHLELLEAAQLVETRREGRTSSTTSTAVL